jgi:hypothetical protein
MVHEAYQYITKAQQKIEVRDGGSWLVVSGNGVIMQNDNKYFRTWIYFYLMEWKLWVKSEAFSFLYYKTENTKITTVRFIGTGGHTNWVPNETFGKGLA